MSHYYYESEGKTYNNKMYFCNLNIIIISD